MPTTIVIADDHTLVRAGLRSLITGESDLEVVGEAGDGETALRLVDEICPNVLLADVSMPPPTGIELAGILSRRKSYPRVLVVTMHEDSELIEEAKRAGASGYLSKRAAEAELCKAIRVVASGGSYWPPAEAVAYRPFHENHAPPEVLTEQDRQLIRLLVKGLTLTQIADALGQSPEAVESARLAVTSKLGLRGRASLIRFAYDHGLV